MTTAEVFEYVVGIIGIMRMFKSLSWRGQLEKTYHDYFMCAMRNEFGNNMNMNMKYKILFCQMFVREIKEMRDENSILEDYEKNETELDVEKKLPIFRKMFKLFRWLKPEPSKFLYNDNDNSYSSVFQQLKIYCMVILGLIQSEADKICYFLMSEEYKDLYLNDELRKIEIFELMFSKYDMFVNRIIQGNHLDWIKQFEFDIDDSDKRISIDKDLKEMFHVNHFILLSKELLNWVMLTQQKLNKDDICILPIIKEVHEYIQMAFGYNKNTSLYLVKCCVCQFYNLNQNGDVLNIKHKEQLLLLYL